MHAMFATRGAIAPMCLCYVTITSCVVWGRLNRARATPSTCVNGICRAHQAHALVLELAQWRQQQRWWLRARLTFK